VQAKPAAHGREPDDDDLRDVGGGLEGGARPRPDDRQVAAAAAAEDAEHQRGPAVGEALQLERARADRGQQLDTNR